DAPSPWSDRITPKQRQFITLLFIGVAFFALLWLVFVVTDKAPPPRSNTIGTGAPRPTTLGVMAPGAQLDPREKWIGEAGKEVAQLKQDRDQTRSQIANQERFNQEILNRFDMLKQDLAKPAQSAVVPAGTSPAYPPSGALAA